MTFCCPPSTALHQTTPNSSLEILPCALLLPPTSTLDAVEASKHRFPSVARPQRRPPVSPSLLAFSTFPDRRPAHHPRRPSLFSPKPSRVTIGSFDPPPLRPLALDCPSYNFILPRPTVRVARSSTAGPSRPPSGRWISSGPKLAGRPAPGIHHITSRCRRSTQQQHQHAASIRRTPRQLPDCSRSPGTWNTQLSILAHDPLVRNPRRRPSLTGIRERQH